MFVETKDKKFIIIDNFLNYANRLLYPLNITLPVYTCVICEQRIHLNRTYSHNGHHLICEFCAGKHFMYNESTIERFITSNIEEDVKYD